MKKNILTSVTLSFSIVLSCLPAYAGDNEAVYEELLPVLEETKPYELIIEGEGAVPIDDIVNDVPSTFALSPTPSYYNSAEKGLVTSVKSQNPYGTCWSFSTTSAMETSMIKNGYAVLGDVDYSELHLAYFAHSRNSYTGDGENVVNPNYGYYGGGSTIIAAQCLAGWQGMADEEDFPYPPKDKSYTLPESARYISKAHLQDYYVLDYGSIKEAIMEYGSVVASFYDDNLYFSGNAYYSGINEKGTNHAITIVGWDDEYALSNFEGLTNKPQNPGAWIVKNSWGKNWGDEGYFYLSYEEPTLATFVALNAEPADNYDVIYQYDGATNKLTLNASKYANVFTAENEQDLEAIGLYTSFPYTDYTVNIYKLNENHTSPEDGSLVGTLSGTEQFVGFHTLELETFVPLKEGDKFSVVCSLSGLHNMSYVTYAPFEGSTAYNGLENSSNEGESFIYAEDWLDTYNAIASNMKVNNAAVKAYSSYDFITVKFNDENDTIFKTDVLLNSYLEIPENPEKEGVYFAGWYKDAELLTPWNFEEDMIYGETVLYAKWSDSPIPVDAITLKNPSGGVLTGDTLEVKATICPYYATDKTLFWESSDDSVATVENGIVTGFKKGSAAITVSANGGISAEFTINVYNPMTNIQLGLQKPIFKTTDTIALSIIAPEAESFVVHFLGDDHTHYYTKTYTNSPTGGVVNILLAPLPENDYTLWVEAKDYLGNTLESAKKSMQVTDKLVLMASKNQDGYIAGGYNNDSSGHIIAAYYDEFDNFIGAVKKANSEYPPVTFSSIPGTKTVKFMWWDSISGMNAITNSVTISN